MASPADERNTIVVTIKDDYYFAMVPDALLLDHEVSDRAVRLWALLSRAARAKASPTRVLLASVLGCSEDSIDRAMKELEKREWLKVIQRGLNRANNYVLNTTPDSAASAPSIESVFHAGVRTGAESGVRTRAHSESAPVRSPSSSVRGVREVLPADSASQQDGGKAERVRARIDARRDGKPRPRLRSVPDGDDGYSEDEGRILGKDLAQPVAHRPGSGAGLAAYFGREASKVFDLTALGPRQLDERALARHLKTWRSEGQSTELIREMIDVYCSMAQIPKNASPLWQDFLARKGMLYRKAQRSLESTADPATQFVDPPVSSTTKWTP